MADYDSALPIRGEVIDGDTVDANYGVMLVGGSDGSNYQVFSTDSSGALNVNASLTWDDTNKVHITDGTEDLAINVDGSINVGINSGETIGLDAGTNDIGIVHLSDGTTELDVAVDGSAAKTNGIQILGSDGTNAQIIRTDSSGSVYVNTSGAPDDSVVYGTANLVKDTATTVVSQAGAATVAGIQASGSGLMKVEVKYGTTGSEAVIAVLFNSTANPNITFDFPNGLSVGAGETILLSCTNLERRASPASDFSGYGSILTTA